ncbi:partner of bursicon-like [Patiria miniata]|uniref:Bursicon n=1 Tax=Patiria miniata TaxID=46514 RepID=A0A913YYF8_PATMI|nr:partner of bursicon-like [Patiria miniata]
MDCARSLLCLLLLHCLMTTIHSAGTCRMSFQRIEVQKDVVLASGKAAVCFGTPTASSCIGGCPSFTASSIHEPTGFTKKCTCCRETQMMSQSVVLSPCFDPEDGELIEEDFMDEFQQPSGCECGPCTL